VTSENLWITVAIAMTGNVVAVLIVLVTNRQTTRREETRQEREDERLEKGRFEQRVDRAIKRHERLVGIRTSPYVDFYQELRDAALQVHDVGYGLQEGALPFGWQLAAYDAVLRLEVYATPDTHSAAQDAYIALWRWGNVGPRDYESDEELLFDTARTLYLSAARHDLGIQIDASRLSDDVIR